MVQTQRTKNDAYDGEGTKMFTKKENRYDLSYLSKETFGNVRGKSLEISEEFEKYTGLQKKDVAMLFFATALQCVRIYAVNEITKIEKAGHNNKKEKSLHDIQKELFEKMDVADGKLDRPYFASLDHIVKTVGVPYDATSFFSKQEVERLLKKGRQFSDVVLNELVVETADRKVFKGANHRFATLGHDPVLGMVFGTANIMTNTITVNDKLLISTKHVVYTKDFKDPKIATNASTIKMIDEIAKRMKDKEGQKAFIASLIKQIIHIGTDKFTTVGLSLPGSSLVLDKSTVEKVTKYVSYGDVVKQTSSAGIAVFINYLIEVLHTMMFDDTKDKDRKLYKIRTNKIIDYSNAIATSSNLVKHAIDTGVGIYTGDAYKVKNGIKGIDFGGLTVLISRLIKDKKFQEEVEREFIREQWGKHLYGGK